MAGIYQRDNLKLDAALDAAIKRKEAYEQREAERLQKGIEAGTKGLTSVGDYIYSNYGLEGDLDEQEKTLLDKIASLKAEAKHNAEVEAAYNDQVNQRKAVDAYFQSEFSPYEKQVMDRKRFDNYVKAARAENAYKQAMLGRDMLGYSTTPVVTVPNYSETMNKRGLY